MVRPIITLTTDFGSRDPYVAEMKGVILGICPEATVVDISHSVEKFNIGMGAYILAAASSYFPKGTIHVAVVDPGVGTKRESLCIETKHAFYIGPDNGLLSLAAKAQHLEHIYRLTNKRFMLPKVSNTFHGRDVFAPVAAHLARGTSPSDFGPEIEEIVMPTFAGVTSDGDGLVGEVIHIDDFGNIVTNMEEKEFNLIGFGKEAEFQVGNARFKACLCRTYGEVGASRPLALIGSHGFLEISVNHGNAAELFKVKHGDSVVLHSG